MARRWSDRIATRAATHEAALSASHPYAQAGRRRLSRARPPLSTSALASSPLPVFPLVALPPELISLVASFLRPRSLLALYLTSTGFAHLSSYFKVLSRQEYTPTERGSTMIYTPLQFFCSRGMESIVARLLEEGADPNGVSSGSPSQQISPLIRAIGSHSPQIVSMLLQHGAHVNGRDGSRFSFSPLEIAVGQPIHFDLQPVPDERTFTASVAQLPQIVDLLLAAGADIHSVHPSHRTPLHMQCVAPSANPRIVASLIAAGADVNYKYTELGALASGLDGDIQAMHFAASAGHAAIVRLLLDAGADIEARTRDGVRPLDTAILTKREEVVELLLNAGADTDICIRKSNSGSVSREVRNLLRDAAAFEGSTNLWTLVGKDVEWAQLHRWLAARGCLSSWRSMDSWGIRASHNHNISRSDAFLIV